MVCAAKKEKHYFIQFITYVKKSYTSAYYIIEKTLSGLV